ncbi:MAG: hypothetical protein ABJO27_17765 [Pseudoruegeria sp.]
MVQSHLSNTAPAKWRETLGVGVDFDESEAAKYAYVLGSHPKLGSKIGVFGIIDTDHNRGEFSRL